MDACGFPRSRATVSARPRSRRRVPVKIVSACLLGIHCNFEGASWRVPAIVEELGGGQLFPVCPEVLGGLPVPRTPAEIRGGSGGDVLDGKARVVTEDGRDVTDAFVEGARRALAIAQAVGATEALLTERSPSCGLRPHIRRDVLLQVHQGRWCHGRPLEASRDRREVCHRGRQTPRASDGVTAGGREGAG